MIVFNDLDRQRSNTLLESAAEPRALVEPDSADSESDGEPSAEQPVRNEKNSAVKSGPSSTLRLSSFAGSCSPGGRHIKSLTPRRRPHDAAVLRDRVTSRRKTLVEIARQRPKELLQVAKVSEAARRSSSATGTSSSARSHDARVGRLWPPTSLGSETRYLLQ